MEENTGLKPFGTGKFLNFALGFLGLQFAWQMRIILSAPVTEGLGASPLIYGLIWLAGPFTGMVVQPLIGAISDNTKSRFGRRRPYLFMGAVIAALALWAFPNSANIAGFLGHVFGFPIPVWLGLFIAAIMIWIIDACINIAQGPYRALIPDVVPQKQHAVANSYISLAIGLGSVIAAGTAPFLKYVCHYQMSVSAQFVMAALAFVLAMTWTCITIQEKDSRDNSENKDETVQKSNFWDDLRNFFLLSPQVGRICLMQFFTWIGMMCLMIFFTSYAIHTVYAIPDLSNITPALSAKYSELQVKATNYSSICFAIFNLICFIIAIPIGFLAQKFGNKKVHIVSLLSMVLAYLGLGIFNNNPVFVAVFMALSGIGWASVCALPFAMLSKFIVPGTEGSVMGIFNIFIAGPQVIVCTVVSWLIKKCVFTLPDGINYHWEYAFFVGALCLLLAAVTTYTIKEEK